LKKFEDHIKIEVPPLNKDETREAVMENATAFTNWLSNKVQSCTTEAPLKRSSNWWNDGIENLERKYYRAKTRSIRCRHPELKQILKEEAKEVKKLYAKAIYEAKEGAWREFITRHQAWGRPYKLLVKDKKGYGVPPRIKYPGSNSEMKTESRVESEELLLKEKFPELNRELEGEDEEQREALQEEVLVTNAEEIAKFLKKRNNKKAPGKDRVRWKHLEILHKNKPELLVNLFNGCLKEGVFPQE